MPRKTATVTVPEFDGTHNRDQGKIYLLTEWPAAQAEKWGLKMMLAYNRSSGSIPLDMRGIGMEGIAIIGINTFLRGSVESKEVIPLMDELLGCVQCIRDRARPDAVTPFTDDDTEEIATRLWLRAEVLSLHINFSVTDALAKLWAAIQEMQPSPDLPSALTSQPESPLP